MLPVLQTRKTFVMRSCGVCVEEAAESSGVTARPDTAADGKSHRFGNGGDELAVFV